MHPAATVLPRAQPTPPDFAPWYLEEALVHERVLRVNLRQAFPILTDLDKVVQETRVLQARRTRELESVQVGRMEFNDAPLAEAVAEISRHQQQQVVLQGAARGDERVGGSQRIGNVEGFVRLLEASFPLVVEQRDGNRIVLARRL